MLQVFVDHRNHREYDDDHDRDVDLVAEAGEGLAEEDPGGDHDRHPEHGADGTPGEEALAVHPAGTRDQGDERAHDRDEAADDQCLVAVLVEEGVGLVEVVLLQDLAVALVDRGADRATDLVADHVARERHDHQQRHRHVERHMEVVLRARAEQADGEQQRVAGKDREEDAALDEHDQQGDHEERTAELVQQVRRVHEARAEGVHHARKRT